MGLIFQLRNSGLVQRVVDTARGCEEMALLRRRALYDLAMAKYKTDSLYRYDPSINDLPNSEGAINKPSHGISYYILRSCFLKDFELNREALCRELAGYTIDGPHGCLSIDHTRRVCRRIVGTNGFSGGYIVALLNGMGLVLNIIIVSSTATSQLKLLFSEMKGRISVPADGSLTIYTDNACCGGPSETLKDIVASGCGVPRELIKTRLDGLHGCMRLVRVCDPHSPLYCRLAKDIGSAMYMVSEGDLQALRAKRLQRGQSAPPSKEELRRAVRRRIPSPPILRLRLLKVAHTYYRLDQETEKQRRDGKDELAPRCLLTKAFWSNLNGLLRHVDHSCLSDDTLTNSTGESGIYVRDRHGGLVCRRGTSKSEARHSALLRDFFSLSRLGAPYADAKLLWRVIYSNRSLLHELTGARPIPVPYSAREVHWACGDPSAIDIVLGDSPITFGSRYLQALDHDAFSSVFHQWCEEDDKKLSEGSGVFNDPIESDVDADEGTDLMDLHHQVANFEDIDLTPGFAGITADGGFEDDEEFMALTSSPHLKKKHLQIRG
ncbi:hypothetical protein FOZ63_005736, partial [Perkinsus olseni]